MKIANNRLPITSFVLVDETGRVIDDLENLNEHTQLKAIAIDYGRLQMDWFDETVL